MGKVASRCGGLVLAPPQFEFPLGALADKLTAPLAGTGAAEACGQSAGMRRQRSHSLPFRWLRSFIKIVLGRYWLAMALSA
jgi:hypothetical protein